MIQIDVHISVKNYLSRTMFDLGTCEASRFDSNSNRMSRFEFDSKVRYRFENFESAAHAVCRHTSYVLYVDRVLYVDEFSMLIYILWKVFIVNR